MFNPNQSTNVRCFIIYLKLVCTNLLRSKRVTCLSGDDRSSGCSYVEQIKCFLNPSKNDYLSFVPQLQNKSTSPTDTFIYLILYYNWCYGNFSELYCLVQALDHAVWDLTFFERFAVACATFSTGWQMKNQLFYH